MFPYRLLNTLYLTYVTDIKKCNLNAGNSRVVLIPLPQKKKEKNRRGVSIEPFLLRDAAENKKFKCSNQNSTQNMSSENRLPRFLHTLYL